MRKVVLRFPEVGHEPTERPQACPRCGHTTLQGWGTVEKRVFDTHGRRTVIARRYRCTGCGRTFLFYPEGVTRRWRSERVVRLCGLLWGLGVSVRGIVVLLEQFGIRAGRMTVWRDIRAVGEQVKQAAAGGKVRVLGVDGFRVRVRGQGRGMVVALDMGEGLPVVMLEVDETDPQAMQEALAPLVKALGVEVVVTDDLGCFRSVTEGLGVKHQVCAFHMLRWVRRALDGLRRRLDEHGQALAQELWTIVHARAPEGDAALYALYERIVGMLGRGKRGALWELAQVALRLSNQWKRYVLDRVQAGVPATNNRVERMIGRLRQRVASVRGVKSPAGLERALWLSLVQPA